MFPFFGFRNFQKNTGNVTKAIEKMNKNELTIENVLDEEELVTELKSYTFSQLMNFLNKDNMINIMNYIIKEPEIDDKKVGHKYPYNACEILCSENAFIIDKFFEEKSNDSQQADYSHEVEKEEFSGRTSILFENSKNKVEGDTCNFEEPEHNFDEEAHHYKNNSLNDKKLNEEHSEEKPEDEGVTLGTDYIDQVKSLENDMVVQSIEEDSLTNSPFNQKKDKEYPLVDYFFSFLEHDEELNFVLAGYFFKLFNHISNYRSHILNNYILIQKPFYVDYMIKHMNRRSIADCILKILTTTNKEFNESSIINDLILKILNEFESKNSLNEEILEDKRDNICSLFNEILMNRQIYYVIAQSKEIILKLFTTLKTNMNNPSSIHILKIIISFFEQLIKDTLHERSEEIEGVDSNIDCKNELNLKHYADIFEITYEFYDCIMGDFISINTIEESASVTTYEAVPKNLSSLKLCEFEYFKLVIELLVNIYKNPMLSGIEMVKISLDRMINKIIISGVFKASINYFFEYEMNNFYQNLFEKWFSLIMDKSTHDVVINQIFGENSELLERIIFHLFCQGISFRSGSQIMPGYFSTLCTVADHINKSENNKVMEIIEKNDEWKYLSKILLQELNNKYFQGLLYNPLDSPFKFKKKAEEVEPIEKKLSIKEFVYISCFNKFEKFKKAKKEDGLFDYNLYIKNEEEKLISIDIDTSFAVSISIAEGNVNNEEMSEECIKKNIDESKYLDTNFFWKTYNVDVDISDL